MVRHVNRCWLAPTGPLAGLQQYYQRHQPGDAAEGDYAVADCFEDLVGGGDHFHLHYAGGYVEEVAGLHLDRALYGEKWADYTLADEDIYQLKRDKETFDQPWYVTVGGEVRFPGGYVLESRYVTLSQVIKMAGGLTELAYPKGARFFRNSEHLADGYREEQVRQLSEKNMKYINT